MPIEWDELSESRLRPDRYTPRTAIKRLRSQDDAWQNINRHARRLPSLPDGMVRHVEKTITFSSICDTALSRCSENLTVPLIRFSASGCPGAQRQQSRRRRASGQMVRGGPDGNEQLTAATGVVLLILLAALGVTIVSIGGLLSEHLFLGLLLLGPVALKMASTGYRFMRYYTHDREYVRRGPPELWLRVLGPSWSCPQLAVFATGVWLLIVGPAAPGPGAAAAQGDVLRVAGGHGVARPRPPGRRCPPRCAPGASMAQARAVARRAPRGESWR